MAFFRSIALGSLELVGHAGLAHLAGLLHRGQNSPCRRRGLAIVASWTMGNFLLRRYNMSKIESRAMILKHVRQATLVIPLRYNIPALALVQ